MAVALAPDDIVASRADVADGARAPLVVLDAFAAFLDDHAIGGSGEPVEIEPIGDGHSNVTLAVRRGEERLVLRRPPRGPLPPSAHDVLREARVLTAVAGRGRVPPVRAVCEDPAVIGVPFFVMDHVDGHVVTDTVPPELDSEAGRRQIGEELVDALVELHAIDPVAAGLEGFGKPTGYLERQLRRFGGLWEHNRTRELPAVERTADWLRANLPAPDPAHPATIVHGDYRLGNVILGAGAPARVVAILDWEMATLGDPLADLGYLLMMWPEAGDPSGGLFELGGVTRQPGFPTRAELVARYEDGTGRALAEERWYTTLALWKAIVFMEGNYKRAIAGTTDDPYLASFGDSVVELAERAEALTRGA